MYDINRDASHPHMLTQIFNHIKPYEIHQTVWEDREGRRRYQSHKSKMVYDYGYQNCHFKISEILLYLKNFV